MPILAWILSRLRPSPEAIRGLAMREADPRRAADFAPIVRGPVFAIVALAGIALLAVLWAPFRLLTRGR